MTADSFYRGVQFYLKEIQGAFTEKIMCKIMHFTALLLVKIFCLEIILGLLKCGKNKNSTGNIHITFTEVYLSLTFHCICTLSLYIRMFFF